jgi:hypothetical protein
MTGWQFAVCYMLTIFFGSFLFVLAMLPPLPVPPEVILYIDQPPRVIYVTPPSLPNRNPKRL